MKRAALAAVVLAGCSLRWPASSGDAGWVQEGGADADGGNADGGVDGVAPDAVNPDAAGDADGAPMDRGDGSPDAVQDMDATTDVPDASVAKDAPAAKDTSPADVPSTCRACSATSPPDFCAGTGVGTCLAAVACSAGCGTCVVPLRTGDRCGADVFVVSTRGRSRYIFSTCGAADDLDIACGRAGPDIVVAFRVDNPGRVNFTFTAPRGVEVYVGYDASGGNVCRDTVVAGRVCAGNDATNVRTTNATLNRGTYHIYLMTNVESTVVVDAELP